MTGGAPTIPEHVINTFCFFTTTFTVIRHYNETNLQSGVIPHPGVGPMEEDDPVQYHAYYQWVPFILFAQSIMFYIPHLLWRSWENGKMKYLVNGLKMIELSKYIMNEEDLQMKNNSTVLPSRKTTFERVSY